MAYEGDTTSAYSTTGEVTQTSTRTEETTVAQKVEDSSSFKYAFAALGVAALLVMVLAILFLFWPETRAAEREKASDDDKEDVHIYAVGGGGGTEPASSSPDPHNTTTASAESPPEPSEATSDEEPTETHSNETETETYGDLPVVSTTTTQPPMPAESLLCTVRSNLKPNSKLPEDGLCDYIFYDSLYENGTINLLGGPYTKAFEYFVEMAGSFQKTESGAGLAYVPNLKKHPLSAISKDNAAIRKHVFELWSKKIYHFGMIDVWYNCFKEDCNQRYLRILRAIFDILEGKRSPERPCYLVYNNIFYEDTRQMEGFTRIANIRPDGMVFTSHLQFKEVHTAVNNCKIMPPHIMKSPPNEAKGVQISGYNFTYIYLWNMTSVHAALRMWVHGEYLPTTANFVSAALEGRGYRFADRNYGFQSTCSGTLQEMKSNVSLTEVCASEGYNITSVDQWGTVAANPELFRAVTYEDAESFRYKFCTMKKTMVDVKYGIIAYSVNTDDTTNVCGEGEYHRLKTLRWLVDFFKNDFNSESDVDKCIQGE